MGLAFIALGVLGPSIAVSWVAGEPYVFLTIRPILGGVLLAIFAYRGLHPDYR